MVVDQIAEAEDDSERSVWKRFRARMAAVSRRFWHLFPADVQSARAERHWRHFGSEFVDRLVTPLLHPTFVFYLVSGVVVLGGIPIEIEWTKYLVAVHEAERIARQTGGALVPPSFEAVLIALHTFYPALAWSAAMQINFADSRETERARKSIRAFGFLIATVTLLLSILLTTARALFSEETSLKLGVVGVVLAVFLWWLANAKEKTFRDPVSGETPQGGSAAIATDAMSGDTKGYSI